MALLYGRNLLDTLHERVGEEEDGRFRANPDDAKVGWGRIIGANGVQHGDSLGVLGGSAGPHYSYTFLGLQAGMDVYRHDSPDGSREQAGAYFAIGGDQGRVSHFDGQMGDSNFAAYTPRRLLDAFRSDRLVHRCGPAGHVLRYQSSANCGSAAFKTVAKGAAASIEGGYPFKFAGGYFIEPQAQLVYQNIHVNDANDIAAQIRFADVDSCSRGSARDSAGHGRSTTPPAPSPRGYARTSGTNSAAIRRPRSRRRPASFRSMPISAASGARSTLGSAAR